MDRKITDNAITEGVIWKQLLKYFFPILLGSFFQQMYNTVDTIVVGRFAGTTALAAVGTTSQFVSLLFGFFVAVSLGATVTVSQFYGSGDEKGVHDSVHTSIAFALIGGLLITAIGVPLTPVVLRGMHVPEDVLPEAVLYLRIFFSGMIVSMLYNVAAAVLRALGDAKRPTIYLVVCCLANVALDLLFVIVFQMGVAGVAIATVLAQAVSAVLCVRALMRQKDASRLILKDIRLHMSLMKEVLRIGIPAGIQNSMYAISNLTIQASVNMFGSVSVAAWTAFGKADAVIWMVMGAFATTITTFAGQNYGAGRFDRVQRSARICAAMCAGTTLLLSLGLVLGNRFIIGLFTEDTAVLEAGVYMLGILAPWYVLYVPIEIIAGTMRGCGESLKPMIIIAIGICGFRTVWVLITNAVAHTVWMLTISYPCSWFLTSSVFLIYYFGTGWMKKRAADRKMLQ